jgi:hypothetical protein
MFKFLRTSINDGHNGETWAYIIVKINFLEEEKL